MNMIILKIFHLKFDHIRSRTRTFVGREFERVKLTHFDCFLAFEDLGLFRLEASRARVDLLSGFDERDSEESLGGRTACEYESGDCEFKLILYIHDKNILPGASGC